MTGFGLLGAGIPTFRQVFVSFHHENEQLYKDHLSRMLTESYLVRDRSLQDPIDTRVPENAMRAIRERYITGTTATIVLCGAQTVQRKFVDWEIKATLDKRHGLIGVYLDTAYDPRTGKYWCPPRLVENIDSGYAAWVSWQQFTVNPLAARSTIEAAIGRSSDLIRNGLPLKQQNG